MAKATERKTIEIARKRVPLKKLLHGKEIRDAAKSLEEFRLQFKEQEFLYGGKITIQVDSYGETTAVVRRQETDKEFADRMERSRLAAEAKKRRERERAAAAEKRAQEEAANKKARAAEYIQKLAKEAGLSVDILDN